MYVYLSHSQGRFEVNPFLWASALHSDNRSQYIEKNNAASLLKSPSDNGCLVIDKARMNTYLIRFTQLPINTLNGC